MSKALSAPQDQSDLLGLARTVYGAINKCPSLLKIFIQGYEKNLSRKLGEMICKTALDGISLGFGAPEYFHQQALHDERLPPVRNFQLVETNGFLCLPGMSLGKRIPRLSGDRVHEALVDMSCMLPALGSVLLGLVDPVSHPYPKLANRWATALDWFGEGNREKSDAIGLAKIATCLGVLTGGGNSKGICTMVKHLLGIGKNQQMFSGKTTQTLEQLIKDIYGAGRSKILHGTHILRLESFDRERQQAAFLTRLVLIECAIRLHGYTGDDEDIAFRTMPAVKGIE